MNSSTASTPSRALMTVKPLRVSKKLNACNNVSSSSTNKTVRSFAATDSTTATGGSAAETTSANAGR